MGTNTLLPRSPSWLRPWAKQLQPYITEQHCFTHRTVTRCLTPEATKTTVQAFIYCCLNYCNALMPYCTVLQTTYCDDFSPSRMRQLTWWLDPTGQTISHQSCDGSTGCIEFKLALLIHKSLNGSTPRYLSDECQLVSDVGRHGFIQLHCISPT